MPKYVILHFTFRAFVVYNSGMEKYKVVLGSASPRRKALLKDIVRHFEVRVSDAAENCLLWAPAQYAMYVAGKKAEAVAIAADELLVTADTTVYFKGEFLGKPQDDADARDMLRRLNHGVNTVYTGVCIRTSTGMEFFVESSDVRIDMTEQEIDTYVSMGLAQGKAGAYGIQDEALSATLLSGSLSNVIGLPQEALRQHLAAYGIEENYV